MRKKIKDVYNRVFDIILSFEPVWLSKVRWIFNPWMIWGLISGYLFFDGLSDINHPRDSGSAKIAVFIGLIFWIGIASTAKKFEAEKVAKEEYLKAKYMTIFTYHNAFERALEPDVLSHAKNEALKDEEYNNAKSAEYAKLETWNKLSIQEE